MSSLGGINELRRRYLRRLYERSGGNISEGVNEDELLSDLGIGEDEGNKLFSYLSDKGLVQGFTFGHIAITSRGVDEVERAMQSSYAEKESRILRKIYDMGGVYHTDWVLIDALVKELGIPFREVNNVLIDLEKRKGLIEGIEEAVKIAPAGIEFLESGGRRVGSAPAVSYTTNIHGPNYGGIQQGTHGSTQNITLTNTNNPNFDRALAGLVELILASSIPDDDKEEMQEELSKVNTLALKEKNPNTLERAKLRLDYIKTGLTGTEIAIKAAPYLTALYNFFQNLPQ